MRRRVVRNETAELAVAAARNADISDRRDVAAGSGSSGDEAMATTGSSTGGSDDSGPSSSALSAEKYTQAQGNGVAGNGKRRRRKAFHPHKPRKSLFSHPEELHFSEGTFHLAAILLGAITLDRMHDSYYETGQLVDWSLLSWLVERIDVTIAISSCMALTSLLVVLLQKAIAAAWLSYRLANIPYICLISTMYVAVPVAVTRAELNVLMSSAVCMQLITITMKMHSFYATNYLLHTKQFVPPSSPMMVTRSATTPKANAGATAATATTPRARGAAHNFYLDPSLVIPAERIQYPDNVTFRNYLSYLFYPTLVYEVSYPRTKRISWFYVLKELTAMMSSLFVLYIIMLSYMVPLYQQVDQMNFFSTVLKMMVPGIGMWLIGFYGIWHCMFNTIAELTRFADRKFYEDWWNATSYDSFYRKWNLPVHEFMLRHVYMDTLARTEASPVSAMIVTMVVSATLHEYVLAVAFRTFRPYLFITMHLQTLIILFSKTAGLHKTRWGNLIVWLGLIAGTPLMHILYAWEWKCRNVQGTVAWYIGY